MTEDEFFSPEPPPDFFEEAPAPALASPAVPAPASAPSFEAQAKSLGLSSSEQETARRIIETLGIRQDDGLIPLVLLQSKTASAFDSVPAAVASATASATESALAAVKASAAAESGAAAQKTANEIKRLIRAGAPSSIFQMWQTWAPLSLFLVGITIGFFLGNSAEYQAQWVVSILQTFRIF